MAESILYGFAGNILTKLTCAAFRDLGLLWGVDDEIDKLKDTLSSINAVLLDAEEQQSKSQALKDWVSKLKDVLYDIDDLIDEFSYETLRRHVLTKDRRKRKQVSILYFKFKSSLKKGHKIKEIKEIRERLKAVSDDKTQFSFSERAIDHTKYDELRVRRETYSFILEEEVIGRNDDKEEIINLLLNTNTNTNTNEDIAVISVIGMGGLGKTALAQSVFNDNMMTEHFELKLWVCVSEEFDVKVIIRKIIECATKKKSESFLQIDSLQSELREQIHGKKYLLVMDDVWNEDHEKWVSLKRLLMCGAKGSRILITTRGEQVAKTFDTTFFHPLQKLDDSNSWLLFTKMTCLEGPEEELENSNLVEIGKEIVKKLKGVPLAIRTIGRLLYDNKNKKNYWSSFKDKELHQVIMKQEKNDVEYMLSILELSYKHLSANLKQCFLYCALFPKDYEIRKDELILLWRAQGFIQPNKNDELLIDIGEDYFLELLSKSFFQEVRKDALGNIETCKMHDLMHDLACSLTKNECVHGLRNDIDKRTHHFSLGPISREESKEFSEKLSNARNLRTFFMLHSRYGREWDDYDKFFHDHLRLRTLSLSSLKMEPKAKFFESIIGKVKHLRYLNISDFEFEDFPNCITKLYKLETLILSSWEKLKKMSSDIKNLISLKHLDLSWSVNLEFLPDSIIELHKLEVLILRRCSKLKGLPRDVKNWINLRHLDLSRNDSIEFLPGSITQLNNLETLLLTGCIKLKELPEDTKKLINLKHLDMKYCLGLTHMPKGLGELTNLQTLNWFVLGKNNGGELRELNGLNKLRGFLEIKKLQFCTGVDQQMKGKLLQLKSGLEELRLGWDNSCNYEDDVYERVLDWLQPHSNLQQIWISGYKGVKLCKWVSSYSLGLLVNIHLSGCKRLQHLPQFDQFPKLARLNLCDLPNIEYIGNGDDHVCSSTLFFPSLKFISFCDMPKLKRWWKWKGTTSTESTKPTEGCSFPIIKFPCLSQLEIRGCPLSILMSWHAPLNLLTIGDWGDSHRIEEDELDVVPWENFQNLSYLSLGGIWYLPKCLYHDVTTLRSLSLWNCKNLKSLPEWIGNLTSLTELNIIGCPILEERCKKDTGEDWPKIAHIPQVELSYIRQ